MSALLRLALIWGLALQMGLVPDRGAALSLIRDAEIEHSLNQLARPLLDQAGLSRKINVMVVNDPSLNAFVADARTVYVHSGLIMRLDTPEELQAVIAHELAHIANGHIVQRLGNLQASNSAARVGLALALAAGLASGETGAATGLAYGAASTSRRAFFVHTRAEESSADLSAARYMAGAGIDPHAMVDVLDMFRGQEALSPGRQDPYARSHPMSADRYRAAKAAAAAYTVGPLDRAARDYWYGRATGKLSAFLRAPSWTLRRIGNQTDEISRMRRAVALHKTPDPDKAIAEARALVAMKPTDPYYNELLGQILLESRRFSDAVAAYDTAAKLAPHQPQILAGQGRALLALDTAASNRKALEVLERAHNLDASDSRMLRDLGLAYARAGNHGMASVAAAERYALRGQLDTAVTHAKRALGTLPAGSPGARRAQDIIQAARVLAAQKK